MELQIETRSLELRKSWQEKIDEEKERLIRHHPGLVHNLRITIEATKHHQKGGYEVRVVAAVPNDTVVVKRKGEKVGPLLTEAFNTLGLQLKELQRKRRQTIKFKENVPYSDAAGVITRIFTDEAYGLIRTPEGQEVYFHENSLKSMALNQLAEGDRVIFGQDLGEDGLCAAWVRPASQ